MSENTIIVTGGNSGLGYEAAKNIARTNQNDTIIIANRNQAKAKTARERIINEKGNHNIFTRPLDLESPQSVRDFASDYKQADLVLLMRWVKLNYDRC